MKSSMLAIIVSAGAVPFVAADRACVVPSTATGQHSSTCQKIKYTYHVPKQCSEATGPACGLIFDVHGFTMNGDVQDKNTNVRALGDKHGFVVVNPSANSMILSSWHNNDYPKVWSILEAVRDEPGLHIDAARVHFMGFSQGSMMTWNMLAVHGHELASAVAMSCPAQGHDAARVAANAISTPILYSSGYRDGLCPFRQNAGTLDVLNSTWGLEVGNVVSQDDHHVRTAYTGTAGQYLETLFWDYNSGNGGICGVIYEIVAGGHCFPGSSDTQCFGIPSSTTFPQALAPFSCPHPNPESAAFKIGEVAVQFFLDHPRIATASVV